VTPGRSLPRLTLALTLLAFVLYGVADERPGVAALAVGLGLVGWTISGSARWRGFPPVVSWVLVSAAIANAVRTTLADGLDVTDFCEFIILIQLVKTFERGHARDYSQIITLDAFLAIGATLLSPALAVGGLILVFLPLLVVTAMQFQLYAGRAEVEQWHDASRPRGAQMARIRVASGRGRRRHAAGVALASLVGGAVIAGAIFLVMPRGVGRDAFGQWTPAAAGSETGFTDQVQLGGEGVISESPRPVLDLEIRDGQGRQLGGPETVHYLRGAVLDRYTQGTWQSSNSARVRSTSRVRDRGEFALGRADPELSQVVQTFSYRDETSDDATLFSVWRPVRVQVEGPGEFGWGPAGVMSFDGDSKRIEYEVRSVREPAKTAPPGVARTPVSFGSELVRRRAVAVLDAAGGEPDPAKRPYARDAFAARVIENHFRQGFRYTLEMLRPPAGADPIEWFLSDRREGHCEYFAAAMTGMCRSAGVNARMVTGYVAAEFKEATGTYVVRQSNAHAWVEVETAPGVWQTFDPTPPADLRTIHRPETGLIARVGRWIDTIEYAWIRSIVGYDRSTQIDLLDRADAKIARVAGGQDAPEAIGPSRPWRRVLINTLIAVMGVSALGLTAIWATRRLRGGSEGRHPGLTEAEAAWLHDQAPFYARMLAMLRAAGSPKPSTDPPGAHARLLAARDAEIGRLAADVADLYYKARFGRVPLSDDERARGGELVDRLGTRLESQAAANPAR